MQDNSIIKNQWYTIFKNNKPYMHLSVKKDFYTEGICVEDDTLLLGYFDYYEELKFFVYNEESYVKQISIKPEKIGEFCSDGTITGTNYKLYNVEMDNYFYIFRYFHDLANEDIKIEHVTEEKTINDINFKIRQKIRQLNDEVRKEYIYRQKYRYGKLKEELQEIRGSVTKDPNFAIHSVKGDFWIRVLISSEAIEDWKKFLLILKNNMEKEVPKEKERWRNREDKKNKKKVKKR